METSEMSMDSSIDRADGIVGHYKIRISKSCEGAGSMILPGGLYFLPERGSHGLEAPFSSYTI